MWQLCHMPKIMHRISANDRPNKLSEWGPKIPISCERDLSKAPKGPASY